MMQFNNLDQSLLDYNIYGSYNQYHVSYADLKPIDISQDAIDELMRLSIPSIRRNKHTQPAQAALFDSNLQLVAYGYNDDIIKPSDAEVVNLEETLHVVKDPFIGQLLQAYADDDYKNAEETFANILKINRSEALIWIQDIAIENINDERIVIAILKLFKQFDYKQVGNVAAWVATGCLRHKEDTVKSAALSLLGHWNNRVAYDMVRNFEKPQAQWLRLKYDKLLSQMQKDVLFEKNK